MFEMRMRVCIENGNAILLKRGKSMSRRSRRERGRPGQHGQRIIDRDAFYIKETPNKGMLITCFDDICDVNLKNDVPWKGGGVLALGDFLPTICITLEMKILLRRVV